MLRIGLTGGIGAGKSTVSRRLAEHGALVVDADLVAREVVEPGTEGLAEVVRTFGDGVLKADGSLDRPALGRIVFADPSARAELEAITHPRIFAETARRIEAAGDDAIVIHDVPLLVELGRAADYHLTIIVGAAEPVRHDRLTRDRGMDPDEAWSRIRAQATDEQRRQAADVWLANEGTPQELAAQVDRLWTDRLLPYDENLRLDRGVRRPSMVRIADYDPQWPVTAGRLSRRITTQLSRAGFGDLTVEHIGSTAVPGLAAKDVIDLQLEVPSLSIASTDRFRTALRAAGVVELRPGEDTPQPWDNEPEHWRKCYANGADPAVVTHVHIRVAGGPAARVALEFRDWLRADAGERASYEAMKRAVAQDNPGGTEDSRGDYVEAKEPWFAQHLPRAHAWAAAQPGGTGQVKSLPIRLAAGAVLAGIGAGIAGALLLWVLFAAQWVATGAVEDATHLGDVGVPVWRVVTVPIVVGLLVGAGWWQLRTRARLVRLESAVHDENVRMPLASTAADGILQVVAVGSGASVGREAAPRALAAAIAERIAKFVGLHGKHRGVLVGCAAAAGLAAVYNVPVTGVLYAIEVIGLAFSLETVITAAIASAVGVVVAWPVVGMGPSYGYPQVHLHPIDLVSALVLIPAGWGVGLAFTAMSNWAHRHRSPAGPHLMLTVPAAMGLVGVLAIWFPTLTGNGKAELQELLTGPAPAWGTLVMLLMLKPIVTSLSVRAAIAGGQLSPALATGGSLGALVAVLTGHGASLPIAVIVGAAAVLAITQHAPAMAAAFAVELTHPGWRVTVLVAVVAAAMYLLRALPISRRVRG